MKAAMIDVDGGFRGVYACGVLDNCLDQTIRFDLGIGVPAGSVNLASLLAAPEDTCGVSTLSHDPNNMKRLYDKGYADGEKIKAFIE